MAASVNRRTKHGREPSLQLLVVLLIFSIVMGLAVGKEEKKKKDIRDYNDADMEKLFMEWEEAEDEHDSDDLMEHERPSPQIDLSQIDPTNPESAMKLTKKGKTLMMFVSVSGSPTQDETNEITQVWQSMLFNANFQLDRYPVSSDRVIFVLKDGSKAWEIKDFLIQQDRCQEVSVESQVYQGKGSGKVVDGKGNLVGVDQAPGDGAKAAKKGTTKEAGAKKPKPKKGTDKPTTAKSETKPQKTASKTDKSAKQSQKSESKRDKVDKKPPKKDQKAFTDFKEAEVGDEDLVSAKKIDEATLKLADAKRKLMEENRVEL